MKPLPTPLWWQTGTRLLTGLGLLALAGCTVGPDFHPPEVKSPTAWVNTDQPNDTAVTSHLVPSPIITVDWWTTLGDPELTKLVREAADQNLTVLQAEARIRASRAGVGQATSALVPTLGASGSFTESSAHEAPGHSTFQTGLDSVWELDIFGATRRSMEAARASLEVSIEDRRDTLVTLVAEVGVDYINLRSEQQLLAIAENTLTYEQNTLKITNDRWKAGFVSELDYENAKSAADSTRSQIPSIQTAIRTDIYTLSVLLGREPGALLDELGSSTPLPKTPDEIPVGLPADLLRRRADIRAAEAQVHADTANVGVVIAQYFPQVSASGSFGFSGFSIGQMAKMASQSWAFGPSINWPIFEGGKISWAVEGQRATLQGDLFAYRNTVLTALQEVETALVAYHNEQQRGSALRDALADNQKSFDLSLQAYTQGQLEFINVLTAELSLSSSRNQVEQSDAALATDLIALYKALGGGWSEFPERDAALLEYGTPPAKAPVVESNHRPGVPDPIRVKR
jgi:NodT family efflux transporter outer membrane factor (OMF) lipoprotein